MEAHGTECDGWVARAKDGKPMSHAMNAHRALRTIGCSLAGALALLAGGAVAACANPLLSGYGGPGQGSQAILGSQLLNEPGGSSTEAGVGGRGGGGGATSARGRGTSAGAREGSAPGASNGGTRAGGTRPSTGAKAAHAGAGTASSHSAGGSSPVQRSASRRAAGGGLAGLTTAELMYTLLAFAALAFTGVLTARLARGTRSGYGH